nr:fumarylacetoacetate hydrolase family protein [Conexibacter arvalis]
MLALLGTGEHGIEAAREAVEAAVAEGVEQLGDGAVVRHAPGSVRLLAPVPRPNSLRDFLVVEEHVRRARRGREIPPEWFEMPVHYKGNVDAVYGPEDLVPWPAYTDRLDYELEVCAVVGKAGRRIAAADAPTHIVGYTIYNDWSARDIQRREMTVGLGPAMGKDFATSLGPCLVTADAFDRDAARMTARVDGETWSSGGLGTMRFSFEEIIEWVSQEQTLLPGDHLGSGTVGGGCGLELDRWIAEGSVVELEVDGIGVLRNRVGRRGAGPEPAAGL